jgi:glycosyltransferase involved in cell wall biosynthesis
VLRLAVVTPRFWPLLDDRSLHLLRLSEALATAGCKVTVVTPRWTRVWPEQMALGPVELIRLPGSLAGSLSTLRWMYSLGRWLRNPPADVVLVAGLKREAELALAAAKHWPTAAILLAGEDDASMEHKVADHLRAATPGREPGTIACPTDQLAAFFRAAGISANKITIIPRAAATRPPRSLETRAAARLALAAVNYDLATTANSIVALAVGHLDEAHRFGDLVRAWRIVSARRPEAKLWIVGDGPERQRLYQHIGDLDQRFRIMLPGMFERLDELLQACDLLLVPGSHLVPPLALLDAIAAGIPVVAAASPSAQQVIDVSETNYLYPPGDIKALAECVFQVIERLNNGLKPPKCSHRISTDEAAEYLALINRLQSDS